MREPLEEVRLLFIEAIELDLSLFKVYELDAAGTDLGAENAWQRLDGLAGALVSDVLESRGDGDARGRGHGELEASHRDLTAPLAPVAGAPFVPFHDAWPHFAERYGLDLVVEIEPFPAREPSA